MKIPNISVKTYEKDREGKIKMPEIEWNSFNVWPSKVHEILVKKQISPSEAIYLVGIIDDQGKIVFPNHTELQEKNVNNKGLLIDGNEPDAQFIDWGYIPDYKEWNLLDFWPEHSELWNSKYLPGLILIRRFDGFYFVGRFLENYDLIIPMDNQTTQLIKGYPESLFLNKNVALALNIKRIKGTMFTHWCYINEVPMKIKITGTIKF